MTQASVRRSNVKSITERLQRNQWHFTLEFLTKAQEHKTIYYSMPKDWPNRQINLYTIELIPGIDGLSTTKAALISLYPRVESPIDRMRDLRENGWTSSQAQDVVGKWLDWDFRTNAIRAGRNSAQDVVYRLCSSVGITTISQYLNSVTFQQL